MLSKEFLTERGYCCGHGCLMCPYEPKHTKGNKNLMGYGNIEKKTLIVSALEIETITLMADTPLMYGNYSSKMHPILPDGVNEVTHGTLGKDKINPQKIVLDIKG